MKYHYILTNMAEIGKTDNKCWQGLRSYRNSHTLLVGLEDRKTVLTEDLKVLIK